MRQRTPAGDGTTKQPSRTRGVIMVLTGGICWGIASACGQFLLQKRGLTTNWLVAVRLLVAGILLLLLAAGKRKAGVFDIWKRGRDVRDILVFAVCGMALCQYTYLAAIGASNAGTATVLKYVGPVMIMLFELARTKQRPRMNELIAIVCVLAGVFLIATHGNIHTLALSPEALFWGLTASVSMVIYTLQPRRMLREWGTTMTIGWGMTIAGVLFFFPVRPWQVPGQWDGATFGALAVVILLGTVLSFSCYLEGVKIVGATQGSMIVAVEPMVATILSAFWLDVPFLWIDLLGFAFVVSNVFLLACQPKKEKQ